VHLLVRSVICTRPPFGRAIRTGSRYKSIMARELHGGRLLRLIAVFKLVKALALFASLVTVLNLVRHQDPSVLTWALRLHVDPDNRYLREVLAAIFNLDARHLSLVAVGTGLYAVLYSVEGLGLWFEQAWAEYLAIVATAGFIPIECYEILGRVSINKVMLLALNVAIVAYLIVDVRHRRATVSGAEIASSRRQSSTQSP
jgi:uncharacterized membrane protein (DUF2068 family)